MGNVHMEATQINYRGGGVKKAVSDELDTLKSDFTNLDEEVNGDATTYPYADVITIPDAVPSNLADCTVKIEPVQSGSGDPSPTNVRPITGHTEASVQMVGKNLLKVTATTTGIYSVDNNGVITVNGLSNGYGLIVGYVNPKSNERYILTGCPEGGGADTYRLDARLVSNPSTPIGGSGDAGTGGEFNASEQFYVFLRCPNGVNVNNKKFYPMIRLATETDAEFVPYAGKTYTIALGDTIYGGTVDFDSGVMTVDRAFAEYDGDEDWQAGVSVGTNFRMACNMIDVVPTGQTIAISNELEYINNYSLDSAHFYIYNSKLYVFLPVANETDFKAWLASNTLQLCYELATPTTIQLTPQQIQLLKGTNTITASTGQISVTANGVSGAIGVVQEQVNATDAALAELADKLPTAPTTDGAYVLTVTVADGTPTYSWESAT